LHHLQIVCALLFGYIIETGPAKGEQLALLANTQLILGAYQQFALHHSPLFFKLFFRKYRSISNCPILAYKASRLTVSSFSFPSVTVNTSSELAKNSCFHRVMWLACTSNLADKAASVSLSFSASKATFALKAAVNFLLVFLFFPRLKCITFQFNSWFILPRYYIDFIKSIMDKVSLKKSCATHSSTGISTRGCKKFN